MSEKDYYFVISEIPSYGYNFEGLPIVIHQNDLPSACQLRDGFIKFFNGLKYSDFDHLGDCINVGYIK